MCPFSLCLLFSSLLLLNSPSFSFSLSFPFDLPSLAHSPSYSISLAFTNNHSIHPSIHFSSIATPFFIGPLLYPQNQRLATYPTHTHCNTHTPGSKVSITALVVHRSTIMAETTGMYPSLVFHYPYYSVTWTPPLN